MVRLRYPLQSFLASGTLNDVITYYTRFGLSYVRKKQTDPVSESEAQGLLRDVFKDAVVSAHLLTEGQKAYYHNLDPRAAACPWYNNFLGEYIKEFYIGVGVSVKSLQTGTITLTNEVSGYHGITPVDRDYAVCVLLGISPAGNDRLSSFCRITLANDSQIYYKRELIVHGLTLGYMVVELNGLPQKVQHKGVTCNGVKENTISITEVDVEKTLLICNGVESSMDTLQACLSRVWLLNSTTLKARFEETLGYKVASVCVLSLP